MAKRHTKQTTKQKLGQYFTTNASRIFSGWEKLVVGKVVLDPFAGNHDLLNWAESNGAASVIGYDLSPIKEGTIQNDSILFPPSYRNKFVISNPPYLSANKAKGDKSPYLKWGEPDLYKCHIASLCVDPADEVLLIVPSNFLCESRPSSRAKLFSVYHIVEAKYWDYPVFDDTNISIAALHLRVGRKPHQSFNLHLVDEGVTVPVELHEEYGYLYGMEFFDYIRDVPEIRMIKTDEGMPSPNTKIVVGLLDNGAWPAGVSINHGNPIYCKPKSFTTYQLTIPDYYLSVEQQDKIVTLAMHNLNKYREK